MMQRLDEELTGTTIVTDLSFPFQGRLDRQGTRLGNVHNLKATYAVDDHESTKCPRSSEWEDLLGARARTRFG